MKFLVIALPFIFSLVACLSKKDNATDFNPDSGDPDWITITQKQFESSGFMLGSLQKKIFVTSLPATGMVHLPEKNKYVVSSYLGGVVQDMELINGQWVKKGEKLFTVTNPELINWQQEYLELQAQLNFLQDEYQRQKSLSEENISAKKNYIKAELDLKSAQAKYGGIQKKLELIGIFPTSIRPDNLISTLTIKANSNGFVSDIAVVKGQFLQPTAAALTLSNSSHLHLELKVLEKDFQKIKANQNIQFSLQPDPGTTYLAKIHQIDPMVDEDRMINIHCHMDDNTTQKMLPGMYVQANIITGEKEALCLPEEAVVAIEGKFYVVVQVQNDHRYKKVMVHTGIIQDGLVEINLNENLKMNDQFLVKGAYYVIRSE